ncbi:patatin-like phospholipase family protein [uncultured Arcticibacterium sp.]|uniref:patatin-like phospholipase family protein n=1 Tax=uncultured Arcticibacterium sp. TaxID=2173042 RepID=UPI0030F9E248
MGQKKIGLCLSGGGARGFAHLGVLQAFDELNIPISMISGSSAGGLAAALYAEGHKPYYIQEFILRKSLWRYLRLSPSRMGLMNLRNTEKVLRELLPHDSFEGLKIPISVCATNMSKGEPNYFSEGELIHPLLASVAIPVAFKPVIINGDQYFDGGLSNNLPLEPLESTDFKIAINVTPFIKRLPVRSFKDVVLKSVYISVDNQTRQKSLAADLTIEPEGIMKFDGFKLKNAEKMFETGYNSALKALKTLPF